MFFPGVTLTIPVFNPNSTGKTYHVISVGCRNDKKWFSRTVCQGIIFLYYSSTLLKIKKKFHKNFHQIEPFFKHKNYMVLFWICRLSVLRTFGLLLICFVWFDVCLLYCKYESTININESFNREWIEHWTEQLYWTLSIFRWIVSALSFIDCFRRVHKILRWIGSSNFKIFSKIFSIIWCIKIYRSPCKFLRNSTFSEFNKGR